MPFRSWVAFLLLVNYLLVIGMGGMTLPQDQHSLLLVQTVEDGQYQQCRYLRLDGLEMFLAEALASHTPDAPITNKHQLLSVVSGMDAHCLAQEPVYLPETAEFTDVVSMIGYQPLRPTGMARPVNAPPWTK